VKASAQGKGTELVEAVFGIVPKSLGRIEQGAEADLEMSSGLTGSNRAVSMKMYLMPCKAVRSNPFATARRRGVLELKEVIVSLGVLIYSKDEAFRRSLYVRKVFGNALPTYSCAR